MGVSHYELENNGKLGFISNQVPAMKDGKYQLSLNLGLSITNQTITDNNWLADYSFYVNGPRFTLQPQDVISVFPPDLNSGDYATTLPTITLSRATLPWERQSGSGNRNDTWLVLLVIDESELEENGGTVSVSTMKLNEYLPQNDILPTDDPESPVVVLSMSSSFASGILPAVADLPYLAHVRQPQYNDVNTSEPRAVIMASRLPRANASSIVYLVSVENKYADTSSGNYLPSSNPERFPVLASWRFNSLENGLDFTALASNLNCSPSTLQIPWPETNNSDPTNPAQYLRLGYVALPHTFRNGQSSVSWYHGPLSPCERIIPLQLPSTGPDALLIYSSTSGMFDAAYASAWELGRQISIQDTAFSNALYRWKRENTMAVHQLSQSAADSHLPVISKMDRWNELTAVQPAYFRCSGNDLRPSAYVNGKSTFASLVGNNLSIVIDRQAEFRKNDTFGQSFFTQYEARNMLSFDSGMLAQLDGNFSISFWFCTNNIEGNQPNNLYEQGQNLICLYDHTNQIAVSATLTNQLLSIGPSGIGFNYCDGEWHHLTLTSVDNPSNTVMCLYVDGQKSSSFTIPLYTPPSGSHRYSGCNLASYSSESSNGMYYGKLANLRLFTDVLDSDDMQLIAERDTRGETIFPYLNKLSLLYKVPFNYLVNNEQMLPAESIRFFRIDQNWINSLIDGAYSIGRVSEAQYIQDCNTANELGLTFQPVMTGFLLRSQIVSGWTDLVVDGYSMVLSDNQVSGMLDLVRMERLSENILICIFEGELKTVDLHIKREAVHCGVASLINNNSGFTINLRNKSGNFSDQSVSGNFKSLSRTIDIFDLYNTMTPILTTRGAFSENTNAAFSLQMIAGVPCVRIKSQES